MRDTNTSRARQEQSAAPEWGTSGRVLKIVQSGTDCPLAQRIKQSGKGLLAFVLSHPLKMSGISPFLTTQKLTLLTGFYRDTCIKAGKCIFKAQTFGGGTSRSGLFIGNTWNFTLLRLGCTHQKLELPNAPSAFKLRLALPMGCIRT